MKYFIAGCIVVLFHMAGAQEPLPPGFPQIGAEGRLLTLKVVPGESTVKLFFAGKEAVRADFNKNHKLVSVTLSKEGKKETLQFRNVGGAYEITEPAKYAKPYSLEIKSEVRGKIEELKVDIPTKNP